ncbi:hypothetical protein BDZ91DRAFT_796880 [Kalaharituber pfeilii]|nr:hypothetical protein BDZ91DRAFT_796880 [Kalaharituber pfeilii]
MEDSLIRDTIINARHARVLGRYNEATSLLLDNLDHPPCSWAVRLELGLNYLHQGYLTQAITTLDSFTKGTAPLPDDIRQRDTIAFLALCLKVRATGHFPLAWEPCLRRAWEYHLRDLDPAAHTSTDITLEILWHEAVDFAARLGAPTADFNSFIVPTASKSRLTSLRQHCVAAARNADALQLIRLEKRLWPNVMDLSQIWEKLCNHEAGFAFLVQGNFDEAEMKYAETNHAHGFADVSAFRLRDRLSRASPRSVLELDQHATDLVSFYEDADYPSGAFFVLHTILAWKRAQGLEYNPEQNQRLHRLVCTTGQSFPVQGLGNYMPTSYASVLTTNLGKHAFTISPAAYRQTASNSVSTNASSASHMITKTGSHPPFSSESLTVNNTRPSFLQFLSGSVSNLKNSLSGNFSPERLADEQPFSTLEYLAFIARIDRSVYANMLTPDPAILRDLETLKRKRPKWIYDFPEELAKTEAREQRLMSIIDLSTTLRIGSPAEVIEKAESIERSFSPTSPCKQSWMQMLAAQDAMLTAYRRIGDYENGERIKQKLASLKRQAPNSFEVKGMFYILEGKAALGVMEGSMKQSFENQQRRPGWNVIPAISLPPAQDRVVIPPEALAVERHDQLHLDNSPGSERHELARAELEGELEPARDYIVHFEVVVYETLHWLSILASCQEKHKHDLGSARAAHYFQEMATTVLTSMQQNGGVEGQARDPAAKESLERSLHEIQGLSNETMKILKGLGGDVLTQGSVPTKLAVPKSFERIITLMQVAKVPRLITAPVSWMTGIDIDLILDYVNAGAGCVDLRSVVTTQKQFDHLVDCSRRFEDIRRRNPGQAAHLAPVAYLGYGMLGVSALCMEGMPLIELTHPSPERLQLSR